MRLPDNPDDDEPLLRVREGTNQEGRRWRAIISWEGCRDLVSAAEHEKDEESLIALRCVEVIIKVAETDGKVTDVNMTMSMW
jgi:hypothetical protein